MLHLKLVNASNQDQPLTVDLQGFTGTRKAAMTSLHANTFEATNSLAAPNLIQPITTTARLAGGTWSHTVPALTIEVIDVPVR